MKIGIVISTTRPSRIGPEVARWIAAQAPEGAEVEIVDLAALDLPFLADPNPPKMGAYSEPTTIVWAEEVNSYDALIVAVAEYNASFSAPLKNAVDTLFAEWDAKPVGLVGYGWGGASRAVPAIEAVLAHVGAAPVVGPALFFQQTLSLEGQLLDGAPAAEVEDLYSALEAKVSARV